MPKRTDDPESIEIDGKTYTKVHLIADGDVAPGFGAYLRRLRIEHELSLRDAAADLRISFTYLQKMETGVRTTRPSVLLMQQIAAVYNVPTAHVFAAAGVRVDAIDDHRAVIDRAFRRLVLHPRLAPEGMDSRHWLDSFSTRQKRQWVEFAQRLARLLEDPDGPDRSDVIDIIRGSPSREDDE
jgi:transcriptional regulator with XRE-family HTH domain